MVLILTSFSTLANQLTSDVEPKSPSAGEPFSVVFTIDSDIDETPEITFEHVGAELQGKSSRGVQIETYFRNGKLTTNRKYTTSFEFLRENFGTLIIKNVKAKLGSTVINGAPLSIKVGAKTYNRDFFTVAVPSKKTVFVGEGIDVNYYIYYKSNVTQTEVREHPKLRKFLKRFHPVEKRVEQVEYNGEIYRREPIYSARVFAEKPGRYTIDSLKLRVQYAERRNVDPFGTFGFGLRRSRLKNIASEPISIEVIPLPAENVPKNFTGLVGKHTFKLTQPKNKFLVNEAIELKLEVSGDGALEALNAPIIYKHPELEEFETNSEIITKTNLDASKTYEYTFLARSPFQIRPELKKLSYFDPDKKEYVEVDVNLPGLEILGSGVIAPQNTPSAPSVGNIERPRRSLQVLAPFFENEILQAFSIHKALNIVLAFLIIFLIISMLLSRKNVGGEYERIVRLHKLLKKDLKRYSELFQLISYLAKDSKSKNLEEIITTSDLSEGSKEYFLELITISEKSTFKTEVDEASPKYNSNAFRELLKILKGKNESLS